MECLRFNFPERHLPCDEFQIQKLEGTLGSRLPEDYRHFIEKYGMTTFRPSVKYPDFQRPEKDGGGIESFYGFNSNDSRDLFRAWKGSQGQIPAHYLPIADGPDNTICLELTGPQRAAVFVHLLNPEYEGDDLEMDMHLIWPDFDGFMRNLRLMAK